VAVLGHLARLGGAGTASQSVPDFQALHILDRFHIVAKMNKALDGDCICPRNGALISARAIKAIQRGK
jgi:hypothetical protein